MVAQWGVGAVSAEEEGVEDEGEGNEASTLLETAPYKSGNVAGLLSPARLQSLSNP